MDALFRRDRLSIGAKQYTNGVAVGKAGGVINFGHLRNPNASGVTALVRKCWIMTESLVGFQLRRTDGAATAGATARTNTNKSIGGSAGTLVCAFNNTLAAPTGTLIWDVQASVVGTRYEFDWSMDPFYLPPNTGLLISNQEVNKDFTFGFEWVEM